VENNLLQSSNETFIGAASFSLRMNGNLEDHLNQGRSNRYRSKGEYKIAEFLGRLNIRFCYEQGVMVKDGNKTKIWHPDFFLPELAVYIEYYGLAGDPDYDRGIRRKNRIYTEMGFAVIDLYPWSFREGWETDVVNRLHYIASMRLDTLLQKLGHEKDQGSLVERLALAIPKAPARRPFYFDTLY